MNKRSLFLAVLLAGVLLPVVALAQSRSRVSGIVRPIPTISYCELLRNRQRYLGKTVALNTNIEYSVQILATGERRNEHEFLFDPNCDSPSMGAARTVETIGVGYLGKADEVEKLRAAIKPIRSNRYGGRGRVLIAGKLAESDERHGYTLRFDVSEVRNLERVILPFQGTIKLGWFYSDTIRGGADWILSTPLKMPRHHAAEIEWENADRFPVLRKKGMRSIVFRSMSATTQMIGDKRWNSVYQCEIVEAQ